MPRFLEDKLKAEAAAKGFTGRKADQYTYGALNNMGAMHGNVETSKGKRMDTKHTRDVKAGRASSQHPHKNLGLYLHKSKKVR